MAGKTGGTEPAPSFSWAASTTAPPPQGWRATLAYRLEGYSWFDALVAVLCVAVVDLIGVLVLAGWQTATCGEACGLRTQLHLMHRTLLVTLAVVIPLPLLVALLLRKGRVAIAVVQALLCVGVLVNAVGTEHRLVPRINGTAHCWNNLYSDADCPWGPKD